MTIDVIDERGLAMIEEKWQTKNMCHFPLIHHLKVPALNWMITLYISMLIGSIGIILGQNFKLSCAAFALPYWYIILLEKSYWNNHTYLYGIVTLLFWASSADTSL